MKSRATLQRYWRERTAEQSQAQYGMDDANRLLRSGFLAGIFSRYYIPKKYSILELGCNVGRNLLVLNGEGYKNLYGIEINPNAVEMMKKEHPGLATVTVGAIEDVLLGHVPVDVIFTMAVLMHLPPESERVFADIARKCKKFLITIEDEMEHEKLRHRSRKYATIFKSMGFDLVTSYPTVPGMTGSYVAQVMIKK